MSLDTQTPSRRQFVKGAVVLGGLGALVAVGGVAVWRSADGPDPAASQIGRAHV